MLHDLASKSCPECGEDLQRIGEEVSEQLDIIPMKFFVRRHVRTKYCCRHCEQLHTAALPAQPIDKGIAALPSAYQPLVTIWAAAAVQLVYDNATVTLDALFAKLQTATDPMAIQTLEEGIWEQWTMAPEPEQRQLMMKGIAEMQHQELLTTAVREFRKPRQVVFGTDKDFKPGQRRRALAGDAQRARRGVGAADVGIGGGTGTVERQNAAGEADIEEDAQTSGKVVAATLVRPEDEIMLITDKGVLVRTRVAEIRELGRATQGVTLISLDEGAKLIGLQRIVENDANAPADEDEADDSTEGTSEA